ncbi:MAG: bifunctional diaminohydroxyphosphoribosylaminopyrimidine deaminase/5-amino-6-(5-phosphoribosylamino)uracil reductase RibD [bacterium]|nr:bifunctional diaminohydroxyphosphoribosylaminopyrimidine deaminase/5-amino-6-(5-phosphoribosylamino)uracil reductase RibD [bacterium]
MKNPRIRDEMFMDDALKLGAKGLGWTNPNPMVGAVIVKNGKIIGRGYHRRAGSAHAEIEALAGAGVNAHGATLYVNLEPCSHFGKTPPCVDAVTKAGIKRVVCSTIDPNSLVRGQGVAGLKKAGISVSVGTRKKEARSLNEAFFVFHEKKRPFVALKFAVSLDGKLATRTGDSKWITGEKVRHFARGLRGAYQAILVGVNTVIRDNPNLGARTKGKKDPLRIIVDSHLRIPQNALVLRDTNVIIATTSSAPKTKIKNLEKRGIRVLAFNGTRVPIPKLLAELRKQEVISVFVEGGGEILGSFIDAKIADKVYVFCAPILVGGTGANSIGGMGVQKIARALRFKTMSVERFGDNILVIASGLPIDSPA